LPLWLPKKNKIIIIIILSVKHTKGFFNWQNLAKVVRFQGIFKNFFPKKITPYLDNNFQHFAKI
jgi:hypothetical protein